MQRSLVAEATFHTRNILKIPFEHYALSPFLISLVVTCTLMPWLWMPWLEALSDLLKVSKVIKNIFLIISLHCMKVKIKDKMLLRRLFPTFTPSIKWIQAQNHPIQDFPNSGKGWGESEILLGEGRDFFTRWTEQRVWN